MLIKYWLRHNYNVEQHILIWIMLMWDFLERSKKISPPDRGLESIIISTRWDEMRTKPGVVSQRNSSLLSFIMRRAQHSVYLLSIQNFIKSFLPNQVFFHSPKYSSGDYFIYLLKYNKSQYNIKCTFLS